MRDVVEAERLADFKFERVGKFLPPRLQPGAPQLARTSLLKPPFGGPLAARRTRTAARRARIKLSKASSCGHLISAAAASAARFRSRQS